ncbi:MAG: rhodanese-like domain-containing protein [Dehalococcoidia bacterium]|nr:MAG: rhodanese-like domain-containing protein [Dehalococcoidia bacterium]
MTAIEHQRIEVTPQEAWAAATTERGVIIDVREPWEWSGGYAKGAQLISLSSLQARAQDLSREKPILFICASGNRSYQAADYFRSLGYDARSVAGGTTAWQLHRLPVQR